MIICKVFDEKNLYCILHNQKYITTGDIRYLIHSNEGKELFDLCYDYIPMDIELEFTLQFDGRDKAQEFIDKLESFMVLNKLVKK